MPSGIENMLGGISPDEEHKVTAIVEQYRDRVRDAVKEAAMLAFTRRGQARHQVVVRVLSGAPDAVVKTFAGDELGAALTAFREVFMKTAMCLDLLPSLPDDLDAESASTFRQSCPFNASQETSDFLRQMVRRIDDAGVVKRILVNAIDPLGTYTPSRRQGSIALYWQMIALVAPNIGTTTEALTLKVLAHEYAHSLSHLGMDADGIGWDLDRFWQADIHVHEGLANYWSWYAVKSSDDWLMREAGRALEAMWPRQSPPYGEFDLWRSKRLPPEAVRSAVREARMQDRVGASDFRRMLGLT